MSNYQNFAPSSVYGGSFYAAEVADVTGTFYPMDGVWGRSEADARARFETIAVQWSTYDATPTRVCEEHGPVKDTCWTCAIAEDRRNGWSTD